MAQLNSQKYTLSLPKEIYDEMKEQARKRGCSIKDVVRQCLKFGLIAMKIDEDTKSEILFREHILITQEDGSSVTENRDTRLRFLW